MAAVLYLLGRQNKQNRFLVFRWGQRFFELNREPLDAYSKATSSEELVALQFEFFDLDHLRQEDDVS